MSFQRAMIYYRIHKYYTLFVVNGVWGIWGPLGRCIRKNGMCKRTRTRECDDPPPLFGGAMCAGNKMDSVKCQDNSCGERFYLS